jgi:beta-N-acetylhexosaminidase
MIAGAGLVATATGLAGCGSSAQSSAQSSATPTTSAAGPTVAPSSASVSPRPSTPKPKPTDDTALRRKIASLVIVGFRGLEVNSSDWIMKAISTQGLGGVILFDRDQLTNARRNISSPKQVTALIRTLRSASPLRLIVSMDQEGGQISRLNPGDGFPATRSEAQIGAINSPSTTRSWAAGMAHSLSSIGANYNYAPVVDLDVNPRNPAIGALGRSFSANPTVVVANASLEIQAMRAAGVRTVLKHFPGFGSATGNTDFGVVDISKTWKPIELVPFQKLIAAGTVDSIMAAHLLNRQLDPSRPASLSHAVVDGLLRGKLGWNGVVVSDDMQAAAITEKYGRAEATALALEAGLDLLVYANQQIYNPSIVTQTVDTVVGLVHGGRLTEAQIDQKVARVNALRPKS